MIKRSGTLLAFTSLLMAVSFPLAAQQTIPPSSNPAASTGSTKADDLGSGERPGISDAQGMVMLDYQIVPIAGNRSIDLMGFHVLTKVNDWMYLGIGGHTPLFKGEYGGFMVFDATAHFQRKLFGNVFVAAGAALGGGGGGKSVEQSRIISGTGGFIKAYAGLGYEFRDFSVGANISRVKFVDSAIDHSQLGLYFQAPFSYAIGPFASSGERVFPAGGASEPASEGNETMLTLGLDNIFQIDPQGSNKRTINTGDLQLAYFMTQDGYWFFNAGAGYRGRPLYNQVFGGVGYRARIAPRVNIYSQLGVGSGGYAPEIIDTGPGLLVFPKIAAEYLITRNLGVSLSAGYLFAPKGSSKNYTIGAALNYHINTGAVGSGPSGDVEAGTYRGYRFNLFQQTEFNVRFRGENQSTLRMLSIQMDKIINDHVYFPLQVSGAYSEYLGYPGYGELVAGIGLQSKYSKDDRFQYFGQLLLGANVHGPILKTGIGLHYGLSDRLAIHVVAGQTFARLGSTKEKFRSDNIGIGITYRFSVPTR